MWTTRPPTKRMTSVKRTVGPQSKPSSVLSTNSVAPLPESRASPGGASLWGGTWSLSVPIPSSARMCLGLKCLDVLVGIEGHHLLPVFSETGEVPFGWLLCLDAVPAFVRFGDVSLCHLRSRRARSARARSARTCSNDCP